jgi:hypothetical protein
MTMFSTAAALVCFSGAFITNGDMQIPLVLLTFMVIFFISWRFVKRKNEEKWGFAHRTGREVFRIGLEQPSEIERMGVQAGLEKKAKKKKKPVKKGNYRH